MSFRLPAYRHSALWKGCGCFPGWYRLTVLCVTGPLMFSEAQGYILVGSARPSHYTFPWSGFFLNGLLQLLPGSTQRLVPGIFLPHGLFSWVRYWQDFTKVHPPWYHNQWEIYTFLYKGDSEAAPLPAFFLSCHLSFPVLFSLSRRCAPRPVRLPIILALTLCSDFLASQLLIFELANASEESITGCWTHHSGLSCFLKCWPKNSDFLGSSIITPET